MTGLARIADPTTTQLFLDRLRERCEALGYTVDIAPDPQTLPAFMAGYVPDVVARREGHAIAFEVVSDRETVASPRVQALRHLFAGQREWHFNVAQMWSDLDALAIDVPDETLLRQRIAEVRAFATQGKLHTAFIMAWPLLEAALRTVEAEERAAARTPGAVIETLTMLGCIGQDTADALRAALYLMNRILHGDLEAQPSQADVDLVLAAIEETLDTPDA